MLKKTLTITIILLFTLIFNTNHAVSIEYDPDFNPYKIVSDYLIYHYNPMSISAIQSFLQQKNSYLANYITEDYEGDTKTAAEIIYQSAHQYNVNAQAIIVLLQKEQGLIQNPSPEQKRLDWATGYAVCDSCSKDDPKIQKYKGFGKQVDNGAGAMRFYKENMKTYDFIKNIGQPYNIDGTTVIPSNYATASLYTYTPHILGNYNFWRIWQRYFGNPLAESPFDLDATTQTKYMAQVVGSASPQLKADEGKEAWYWVEFLNIGTETWNNENLESIYLLDNNGKHYIPLINEDSKFEENDYDEIKDYEKIFAQKKSVAPGEVLRISIPIKPNYNKKETKSYVLVLDNKGWLPGSQVNYELTRRFRYDAELIEDNLPEFSEEDVLHNITLKYKNVGTQTWYKGQIYLYWNDVTKNVKAKIPLNEQSVKPGKVGTFDVVTKIKNADTYEYKIALQKKINKYKYNYFPTGDVDKTVTVASGLAAKVIDFQVPDTMNPNEEYYARILVKNVGSSTWTPNDLVLRSYRYIKPFTRSAFHSNTWHSGFAIDKVKEPVKPGESYTFLFKIKAPKTAGTYEQYYQLEWGKKYKEILIDDAYHKLVKTVVGGLSAAGQ